MRLLSFVSKILDNISMNLIDIGTAVRARREELGLSQGQLAHLSGLSRQTLVGLENGSLNDLGVNRAGQVLAVLGLDAPVPTTENRRKKHGLRMAARNANVSYARELRPDVLARMLVSGDVPAPYAPHLPTHMFPRARCGATWPSWPSRCPPTAGTCGRDRRATRRRMAGTAAARAHLD